MKSVSNEFAAASKSSNQSAVCYIDLGHIDQETDTFVADRRLGSDVIQSVTVSASTGNSGSFGFGSVEAAQCDISILSEAIDPSDLVDAWIEVHMGYVYRQSKIDATVFGDELMFTGDSLPSVVDTEDYTYLDTPMVTTSIVLAKNHTFLIYDEETISMGVFGIDSESIADDFFSTTATAYDRMYWLGETNSLSDMRDKTAVWPNVTDWSFYKKETTSSGTLTYFRCQNDIEVSSKLLELEEEVRDGGFFGDDSVGWDIDLVAERINNGIEDYNPLDSSSASYKPLNLTLDVSARDNLTAYRCTAPFGGGHCYEKGKVPIGMYGVCAPTGTLREQISQVALMGFANARMSGYNTVELFYPYPIATLTPECKAVFAAIPKDIVDKNMSVDVFDSVLRAVVFKGEQTFTKNTPDYGSTGADKWPYIVTDIDTANSYIALIPEVQNTSLGTTEIGKETYRASISGADIKESSTFWPFDIEIENSPMFAVSESWGTNLKTVTTAWDKSARIYAARHESNAIAYMLRTKGNKDMIVQPAYRCMSLSSYDFDPITGEKPNPFNATYVYTGCSFDIHGMPQLELGDFLRVESPIGGEDVNLLILKASWTYDGSIKCTFGADSPTHATTELEADCSYFTDTDGNTFSPYYDV